MILREDKEVKSASKEEKDTMPPLEEDNKMEYLVNDEIFITRHALCMQIQEDGNQQKNIFYTRCYVNDKMCNMIIDGGSWTNVASTSLINKLILPTLKHLRPYKLQ